MPVVNFGLPGLQIPAVLSVGLSEVEFSGIGSCAMASIVVPVVFLATAYYLSQVSTVHSKGSTRNVELNKVSIKDVSSDSGYETNTTTDSGYGTGPDPDSPFRPRPQVPQPRPPAPRPQQMKTGTDELNREFYDSMRLKRGFVKTYNCIETQDVKVTELKMDTQRKQNKLVDFITKNAEVVFWTSYSLTFLNAVLLILCYCGVPKISIPNICTVSPFSIFCAFIACLINCKSKQ